MNIIYYFNFITNDTGKNSSTDYLATSTRVQHIVLTPNSNSIIVIVLVHIIITITAS